MAVCDDRQLTEAQRQAAIAQNQRAGVIQAVRPFTGNPSPSNIVDYLNRELFPAVKATRGKLNEVFRQVTDNAPSGNPLNYYFSDLTANADPTVGRLRFDNATQDTATTIRVSQTNARLKDVAVWLDVMNGSVTTPLGTLTLTDAADPSRFIRFDLDTMTDAGAYWNLAVTPIESSHDNPFVDGESIAIAFIPGVASSGTTLRHFPGEPIYDVRDYGAIGNGIADDGPAINLAIAAANAAPGTIYLMPNHRIATATTQITANAVVVKGRGDGFLAGTQIYIDIPGTSATGFHFNGGQYQGIRDCYFRSGRIYTVECYAVVLEEGFCQFAHNVRVDHHWGAFHIKQAAEARLTQIGTRYLVGATGIKFAGSLGNNAFRVVIDTGLLDQPPAVSYPATVAGNGTAWANSTAYSLGQFKEANGNLYQCTTAGTSSGAGSGPSGLPPSAIDPGTVFTARITDGTCQWAYICPLTFTHVLQENYAYTLVLDHVATLNGVYPFRMVDTAATGTSRPAFAFVNFLETDHNWRGILLERGQEVTFQGCSLGACLSESGVKVASTFGFDWTFIGCKNYGNAKHGFDVNASYGHIVDCKIGNNGQLTSATYDGISVAASVTDFQISGNQSLNSGTASQRYGLSIAASCDDYNVVANNFSGNGTAAILNTPGYATTRVVAWNTPFDGVVNAMVATGAAITTDKLAALTGEVTKASGSTATVIVRSTDFTWTGKHLFGSHFILNTQQNYSGALPATITLNDTTNRLYILVNGDGDIRTITPNSGTNDIGRCVFCYIVGTGTKTVKDNFGGAGGVGVLRNPGNADITFGNRDSFLLVGDSTNGWLVFPFRSSTMPSPVSDGDKGDITVSSSGTVWDIDAGAVGATELATNAVTTIKVTDNNVTLAKLATIAQSRFIGGAEGAGTATPTALTPTQAVAIIDGESPTWTASHRFDSFIQFGNSTGLPGSGDVRKGTGADLVVSTGVGQQFTGTAIALTSSVADVSIVSADQLDVTAEDGLILRIAPISARAGAIRFEQGTAVSTPPASQVVLSGDTNTIPHLVYKTTAVSERVGFTANSGSIQTANGAQTNSTTNITVTQVAPNANSWEAGTVYKLQGFFTYLHTAAATPTLTVELLIQGVVAQTVECTPAASAGTFGGRVEGTIVCRTTGAGGTAMASLLLLTDVGTNLGNTVMASHGNTASAIDTTSAAALLLRMRMTTAVASNTLTVIEGFATRLG